MKSFALGKSVGTAAIISALLLAAGCDKKGSTGGPGVGTTTGTTPAGNATTATAVINSSETFNVTVPSTSTTIKQGESKTVTVGIKRARDFDQAVSLKYSGQPAGVTIDPATSTIKSGDKDTTVAVTAAADAAPGEYVIKVTGHPATGEDSTADLKITIEKK